MYLAAVNKRLSQIAQIAQIECKKNELISGISVICENIKHVPASRKYKALTDRTDRNGRKMN